MSTITIEQKTWVDIKIYKDKFITQLQQKGRGGEQLIAIENENIPSLIKAIGGESELDLFTDFVSSKGFGTKENWDIFKEAFREFRQSERG